MVLASAGVNQNDASIQRVHLLSNKNPSGCGSGLDFDCRGRHEVGFQKTSEGIWGLGSRDQGAKLQGLSV